MRGIVTARLRPGNLRSFSLSCDEPVAIRLNALIGRSYLSERAGFHSPEQLAIRGSRGNVCAKLSVVHIFDARSIVGLLGVVLDKVRRPDSCEALAVLRLAFAPVGVGDSRARHEIAFVTRIDEHFAGDRRAAGQHDGLNLAAV